MVNEFDAYSERVAGLLSEARDLLSEAQRIFETETTAEHRKKWPNVYRLESATKHAQNVLGLANPRIILEPAAEEIVTAATQARDVIREAVTTGGGSLIEAAKQLLNATSQIEVGLDTPDPSGLSQLRAEIEQAKTKSRPRSVKLELKLQVKRTRPSPTSSGRPWPLRSVGRRLSNKQANSVK